MSPMRRILLILMAVLLVAGLCACSDDEIYTVTKDGITFTVDPLKCTISDGTNLYHYSYSGHDPENDSNYSITITYPDGSTYHQTVWDGLTGGTWSIGYNEYRYVPGKTLCSTVKTETHISLDWEGFLVSLVLIVFGALGIWKPKLLQRRRIFFTKREFTEFDAIVNRILAVIITLFGVLLAIYSFL